MILSAPWSTSGIHVMLFLHKREHTCRPNKNKTWILSRKPHSINSVCNETRMSSTCINRLCFQKKLAASSLSFHQQKLLADYLFAVSKHPFWSPITCDPIVIVVRGTLVIQIMYKRCSSAIQSAFPSLLLLSQRIAAVLVVPKSIFSFFRPVAPFILTCCTWHVCTALSFCRKHLLLGCSLRKLGRTVIKTALEADFCFHVNGISTGWSSVTERWSLATELRGSLNSPFIYFSYTLKTQKPSK